MQGVRHIPRRGTKDKRTIDEGLFAACHVCVCANNAHTICSARSYPNHNSAAHPTAHGPPPPWPLPMRRKTPRIAQLHKYRPEHRGVRRREEPAEEQPEQLREQLDVLRRIQVEVEVKFDVETGRTTRQPAQATAQVRTSLPVLPDEQRPVLRETQRCFECEAPVRGKRGLYRAAFDAGARWDCPLPSPRPSASISG